MLYLALYNCDFCVQVIDWYRTTGSAYLHRTDLGDSYHHSQLIQEEHHRFEAQARVSQQ